MIKKLPHEANLLRAAVFVLLLYDRIRKIYIDKVKYISQI